MKILFTSPIIRHPPNGGPSLRIENSLKALSSVCELIIYARCSLESLGGSEGLQFIRDLGQEVVITKHPNPSWKKHFGLRLINKIGSIFFGRRLISQDRISFGKQISECLKLVQLHKPDVIWLGYGNLSYHLISPLKKRFDTPIIVDTDSVWSRFIFRCAKFSQDENEKKGLLFDAKNKRIEERKGTMLADATLAPSKFDIDFYKEFATDKTILEVFPNVIDPHFYDTQELESDESLPAKFISIVGTFGEPSAMLDGVNWFLKEVYPNLRLQCPDLVVVIAGRGSDKVRYAVSDKYIRILGEVKSISGILAKSVASIVPLRYESGTRFKILEAGICKTAIVSTVLGAEGIPIQHDIHAFIADCPQSFSRAVEILWQNDSERKRISDALHNLVKDQFTISVLRSRAEEILQKVKCIGST